MKRLKSLFCLVAVPRSIACPSSPQPLCSRIWTAATGSEQLSAAVELAFQYDDHIILEEAIFGFEVGCAVLGNEALLVGGPDEIELSNGFFTLMIKKCKIYDFAIYFYGDSKKEYDNDVQYIFVGVEEINDENNKAMMRNKYSL